MAIARTTSRIAARSLIAGSAAVLLAASPAAAHTGHGPGGVIDGILHPLTGPDHLLAMVAVGVVAVLAVPLGRAWLAPAAFLGGMLAGGAAGMAGVPVPAVEPLILASVFALALAIAGVVLGERPQLLLAALALAGLAHGHAHGAEAPAAAHPVAYVGAFLFVTAGLHLAGMGAGLAIRNRQAARVVTSAATVAAGALLLV